jgi:hypothetical protein
VPTVDELTTPFAAAYTPPPPAGAGICDICHNAPFAGWTRCISCVRATGSVTHPLAFVVPISLYEIPSQLHSVLRDYKYSSYAQVRQAHSLQVGATLHRFVRDHGDHVRAATGRDWDRITLVPSKRARSDAHPLERAIQPSRLLREQYELLLEPWEPERITRTSGSDRGFRARRALGGERVLLVDDTYTSGCSFHSAASALSLAGADVVAGIVIGRVIRPSFGDEMQELWDAQRAIQFDFGVCCLEP